MFDNSILKKTKQMWKLNLTLALATISSLVLMYVINHMTEFNAEIGLTLVGITTTTPMLGLVFASLSIRCPSCKAKWFWMGISGQSSNAWLKWLLTRTECPKCSKDYSKEL